SGNPPGRPTDRGLWRGVGGTSPFRPELSFDIDARVTPSLQDLRHPRRPREGEMEGVRQGEDGMGRGQMAMRSMPETFAGLLREQFLVDRELRFAERFKIPRWFFPDLVYERKDQAELTDTERDRFLCALNVLIANGTYGNLVAIHSDMS